MSELSPKHMLNSLGFAKSPGETTVVVAMSGGVDSSVVAGMLAEEGYNVIGITLQLYDHGEAVSKPGSCCAGSDIHDARTVAATLDIPHYVLDYEKRFKDTVIDEFAASYMAGETPIPCVMCNSHIKFKDLLESAKDLGADAMATGHYIETRAGSFGRQMFRAADEARDQSYFLFSTTWEQLEFLRFPLGGLHKAQTREIAAKYGLKVAGKSDSQDICFVPKGRYADVISKLHPHAAEPGRIIHMDGSDLGGHAGIVNFTVGQRRGIGVAAGEPLYVIKIDASSREIIVGPRSALGVERLELRDINWLGDIALGDLPHQGLDLYVKIRSTQLPVPATLVFEDDRARILLGNREEGVSTGQACVFYESSETGSRVLGGGWIDKVERLADGPASAEMSGFKRDNDAVETVKSG